MKTFAIDVTTIFRAFKELEDEFLGSNRSWTPKNEEQEFVFKLYDRFRDVLDLLEGLKAKASTDWETLNKFLVDDSFSPMFNDPLDGIGVVSILDMLVKWLMEARICQIQGMDKQEHLGFEIPKGGRNINLVGGLASPLVRLSTKSGDSLWLTMPKKKPTGSMDLLRSAFSSMNKVHVPDVSYTSVRVPELSFDLRPNISFLQGAGTIDDRERDWYIDKAKQQFKLKISREGARVKVATGLDVVRAYSMATRPIPLVFNRPFIGWFTQTRVPNLPIAIFYADYDCWQEAGDLEDM